MPNQQINNFTLQDKIKQKKIMIFLQYQCVKPLNQRKNFKLQYTNKKLQHHRKINRILQEKKINEKIIIAHRPR